MLLIEPLFDGPVDIVGDVHGEIDALEDLLGHLGYDEDGRHDDGRRLVFVGDLTDRGPDSPAVLRKVMRFVQAGHVQCVMGNHELNLLRGELKDGNDWWVAPDATGHNAQPVLPEDKARMTAFIESLPLALERSDLRVVHACWSEPAFAELQDQAPDSVSVLDAYEYFAARLAERWSDPAYAAKLRHEWREFAPLQKERARRPRLLPTIARMDREYQMNNPVCVLTSGEEAETETPFWAGGKWRMVERVRWWERYDDPVPVVIGHYWRRFGDAQAVYADKYGPDLFAGIKMQHCMGLRRNVYCVDFSVGGRYAQRAANELLHMCRLAAVRVPEWQVVYDHGEMQDIER
jgi:hypothetical protein